MALYVNGEFVDESLIEAEASRLQAEHDRAFSEMDEKDREKQLADWSRENVIERFLLVQAAMKECKSITPDAVDKAFEQMINDCGGRENFCKMHGVKELDEQAVKLGIERQMKYERLLYDLKHKAGRASEDEIRAYFDANSESFIVPEMIRASHVVKHPGSGIDMETAWKELERIAAESKQKGNFEELAAENSDCPENGGDLGYFPRGQMVESFENVVFNMEVGQISDVFQTEFGLHVAMVTDKQPSRVCEFDEVRDTIAKQLAAEKQQEVVNNYLDKLREQAVIEEK